MKRTKELRLERFWFQLPMKKKKGISYVCIEANFLGAFEDDAIVCGLLTHPSCGFSFMFGDSFSPSTAVTVWSNESSPVYLWGASHG